MSAHLHRLLVGGQPQAGQPQCRLHRDCGQVAVRRGDGVHRPLGGGQRRANSKRGEVAGTCMPQGSNGEAQRAKFGGYARSVGVEARPHTGASCKLRRAPSRLAVLSSKRLDAPGPSSRANSPPGQGNVASSSRTPNTCPTIALDCPRYSEEPRWPTSPFSTWAQHAGLDFGPAASSHALLGWPCQHLFCLPQLILDYSVHKSRQGMACQALTNLGRSPHSKPACGGRWLGGLQQRPPTLGYRPGAVGSRPLLRRPAAWAPARRTAAAAVPAAVAASEAATGATAGLGRSVVATPLVDSLMGLPLPVAAMRSVSLLAVCALGMVLARWALAAMDKQVLPGLLPTAYAFGSSQAKPVQSIPVHLGMCDLKSTCACGAREGSSSPPTCLTKATIHCSQLCALLEHNKRATGLRMVVGTALVAAHDPVQALLPLYGTSYCLTVGCAGVRHDANEKAGRSSVGARRMQLGKCLQPGRCSGTLHLQRPCTRSHNCWPRRAWVCRWCQPWRKSQWQSWGWAATPSCVSAARARLALRKAWPASPWASVQSRHPTSLLSFRLATHSQAPACLHQARPLLTNHQPARGSGPHSPCLPAPAGSCLPTCLLTTYPLAHPSICPADFCGRHLVRLLKAVNTGLQECSQVVLILAAAWFAVNWKDRVAGQVVDRLRNDE